MTTRLTEGELKIQLDEQLNFLKNSCESYDQENFSEAKRIAHTLRVLLHDTKESKSLLGQLNLKNIKFISTCDSIVQNNSINIAQTGLITTHTGDDSQQFYVPLDNAFVSKELDFDSWWNEIVIIDIEQNKFSRKDIILELANTDGGAHIDSELKTNYYNLSRNNSLGRHIQKNGKWENMQTPELATTRQIGHEVLKSLIKDYSKQPINRGNGFIIGNISFNPTDLQ